MFENVDKIKTKVLILSDSLIDITKKLIRLNILYELKPLENSVLLFIFKTFFFQKKTAQIHYFFQRFQVFCNEFF